jgi:Putative adhesin
MPSFDSPEPISVTLEIGVGEIRINATERADTVVDVRPRDPARPADVAAAEQTSVTFTDGRLRIKAPKSWHQHLRRGAESIEVEIALPAGSDVRATAAIADICGAGRLGECRLQTGVGNIELEQAGPLEVSCGHGDISVGRVLTHAELSTASGEIRLTTIDGTGMIKNSNGGVRIGSITGDLRVTAANGDITVEQAGAGVSAKTARGDIRLGEVTRGAMIVKSGYGKLDVGVRDGVPAWLELQTAFGRVDNHLDASEAPEPAEDAVEVRASTAFGDITVRRALTGQEALHGMS